MTNVVNLNRARKAKARADKEKRVEANRAKFGRSKADKFKDARQSELTERRLDGARRDDCGSGEEKP